MNVTIVIPNYNGEDVLRKNLPKVLSEVENYKDGKIEVIVVDDASTDSSESVISNFIRSAGSGQISNLKFFKNNKNLGFSSTVNKGVGHAKGDIVILLNTDVYPEKGFLDPLLNNFKDKSVFAVGCMDKSIENGKVVLRGRGLGTWKRGFLVHKRGEVDARNTLWVSGGSGAFRKDIWNKLGGLNELYSPFYWEDIDLSYRAQKSGYKVIFEPKSVVFHEHEKGWKGQLHESPVIEGEVGELNGYLLHYTHRTLSQMLKKTIEWSRVEAQLRYNSGHPKMSWWRFPRVMISTFFDYYIVQRGYKIGTAGLIESMYQSFSIFVTYARLWELQNSKKND